MRRREFIRLLGGAAVLPITARAQQSAVPLIGYLSGRSPEDTVGELEAFHKGLGEGGFVNGGNVNIEYRWARGDYEPAANARRRTRATTDIRAGSHRWRCLGSRRKGGDRDHPGCLQYGR